MASGMTKTQLVRRIAERQGVNNKSATVFLEHLADLAIKETKGNGLFVLPGLGRLIKTNRKARTGRNPQTGEPIKIPAKTVAKFRRKTSASNVTKGASSRIKKGTGKTKSTNNRQIVVAGPSFSNALKSLAKVY